MFKKILVLLMMGTLPMFAFTHAVGNGGYGDLDITIIYIIGFSLFLIISGLIYIKHKGDKQLLKIMYVLIGISTICFIFIPITIVFTLPLLDFMMIIYLVINLTISGVKKLF